MTRSRCAALAATVVLTLASCSDDDGGGGDACAGSTSGDINVHVSGGVLTDGVVAPVESADVDADPPRLSLRLDGAPRGERDNAVDLGVGDSFTVKGHTYTVAGFCEDNAWLDESGH